MRNLVQTQARVYTLDQIYVIANTYLKKKIAFDQSLELILCLLDYRLRIHIAFPLKLIYVQKML